MIDGSRSQEVSGVQTGTFLGTLAFHGTAHIDETGDAYEYDGEVDVVDPSGGMVATFPSPPARRASGSTTPGLRRERRRPARLRRRASLRVALTTGLLNERKEPIMRRLPGLVSTFIVALGAGVASSAKLRASAGVPGVVP